MPHCGSSPQCGGNGIFARTNFFNLHTNPNKKGQHEKIKEHPKGAGPKALEGS
jgi:hypothetical protein